MFKHNSDHNNMSKGTKAILFLGFIAVAGFALGKVIMFLWNRILVDVADVKAITFWQAIGLFVLARILFGGFRFGEHRKHWKKKKAFWREKWTNMSDEEREAFKQKWKNRCSNK